MAYNTDIDIDVPDRSIILEKIRHIPASIREHGAVRRHNSGVYVTDIPYDPRYGVSALDYRQAETRGYFKLDILNMNIYKQVRDEEHLRTLMGEPDWSLLSNEEVVGKLIHIHAHYQVLRAMPEPVNSIPRMAMFLAIIRPAKRYLVGRRWTEVATEVWNPDGQGRYVFKKSHAIAYAQLVVVNMNLYRENPEAFVLPE